MSGDSTESTWLRATQWFYYVVAGLFYTHKWLLILSPLSAAIGGFLLHFAPGTTWGIFGLVAILVGAVGAVVGIVFALQKRRRHHLLNPALDILHLETTYVVLTDNRYRFALKLKVRALMDGVEGYYMKLHWTGSGDISAEATESCHVQLGKRRDVWEIREVRFPHQLERGALFDFDVLMKMTDIDGRALPYLGRIVDDYFPNGFTMRVILPEEKRTADCGRTVFSSGTTEVAVQRRRKLRCDEHTGEITWHVPKPRLGFRYVIDWRQSTKT